MPCGRWVGWVALPLLVAGGCGDGDGPGDMPVGDGGVDANIEGVAPPAPPAEPMPPTPASMAPCRDGWEETAGPDGTTRCEPFPAGTPDDCSAGEGRFPGVGCAPVGDPCPVGEWPEDLPGTGVIYVRAGATSGIGTRDAPFGRISNALRDVPAGGIIALSKGTHDENVTIRKSVALRGACTSETILTSSLRSLGFGVVEVRFGTVRIEDVTVTGPRQGLRFEGAGVVGEISRVAIEDTLVLGLAVFSGAAVTGNRVAIRRTAPHDLGDAGRGIGLEDSAELTLATAVLEDNHSEGIAVLGSSTARLTDVAVRRTQIADGFAEGVSVAVGSRLEAAGLVVEDNEHLGFFALFDGTTVDVTDAVLRRNADSGAQLNVGAAGQLTRVSVSGNGDTGIVVADSGSSTVTLEDLITRGNAGRGLAVQEGGTLVVRRVAAVDNTGTGLIAASDPMAGVATLTLEDVLSMRNEGAGLQIQEGGTGSLARAEIAEPRGAAIVVRGEGTVLDASDLHLHDMRPDLDVPPEEERGRGMEIRVGANATVDRLRIERALQLGVFVEEATATLSDVIVLDAVGRSDIEHDFGRGLEAQRSELVARRVRLERNQGAGIVGGQGSTLDVSDLSVADTRGGGMYRATGKAIGLNGGTTMILARATMVRNREITLAAFEPGTSVIGEDIVILESRRRDCPGDICAGATAGIGIGVYLGAHMGLTRFYVGDSALIGAQLAEGTMDLTEGQIVRNPVGINVQVEGFDFDRLTTGVELVDNDRNVDATVLPVPDGFDPTPGGDAGG